MTSHEPQAGDRYDAPWGSYAVLRVNADASVTLLDCDRPSATVRPSRAKLAADYVLVQAATTPAPPVLEPEPAELAAPAWVEPLETCNECKRRVRVVYATDDEDGPVFCGACLSGDGGRGWRAPSQPGVRAPGGGEDVYATRAELGSFARPTDIAPAPRPKPAPPPQEAVRDLWAEISKGVAR